jgi:hypothetical protein
MRRKQVMTPEYKERRKIKHAAMEQQRKQKQQAAMTQQVEEHGGHDDVCFRCRAKQFEAAVMSNTPVPREVLAAMMNYPEVLPARLCLLLSLPVGTRYAQAARRFAMCGHPMDGLIE